ncbi:MAG: glycosyltransferase [Planctomycetota bacterium]
MACRIAHLCYAGPSGASAVALNIAGGSDQPMRHAFVLLGRCDVHPDHARTLDGLGCAWQAVGKRSRWDLACYTRAAKALVAMAPEVAVFHGLRTLPVMWALGRDRSAIRRIVMVHTAPELLNPWGWRQVAGRAMKSADAAVAVSEAQKHWLASTPPMSRFAGKLCHIPNGLDVDFWRGQVRPPTHRPTRLAMVGSLVPAKDHGTLLEAVGKLTADGYDLRLTLVGDGPLRGELAAMADRVGLAGRVTFAGTMGPDGVRNVLRETDLYVHASRAESFGLAAAEAMLAGVGVVASRSAGMAELLEDGALGRLTAPGDPQALAAGIRDLIDNPVEAGRRATDAQIRAFRAFDRRRMSRDIEALADSLVG